ncbi:hypothetical protein [Cytobacillus gottheilii]|uniref:hypothetical protein n=1 Tax=Cytobacillus gottheilii TaxID=859144 RepID=UPI0008346C3C|nr:hypothetical protein [Cytobacillus gottheilii]
MLGDILQTLLTLWGSKDAFPTEEKQDQHLRVLRNEEWFQPLFSEHMELFLSNKDLRFFIGVSDVESILADSKKKKRFEEDLRYLVRNIVKRNG